MDRFVWIVGAFLVVVPHLITGLLSDYKICGDPECASPMSRVQAIKDHRGKDCRFLSFRRGDTIFVYHKLTGRSEDLWAGSIDKQFGYFPNDAVREEQIYATTEKVVETQKSDFFCMDEFGYPIDTTDLDSDDDDDDQKLQTQESETIQVNPNTQDTNAEGPITFIDPSTQSLAEEQEVKAEENKNLNDAAEPHEEAHEASTQEEQGGSPSSSWLGSSVTGWFGLSKEEKSDNLKEGEKENELKETKADASLTSSVTGWLGFGGDMKPDIKESVEQEDSVTSTVTDWFGFGGEKNPDAPENKEQEPEPTETFRSRRMSLDLEGSELFKEEKKDMGTLDWLSRGLSSRLGFGKTNQDPGQEISRGEGDEEKEQSSSWMDVGIGGILGLGNENTGADKIKESSTEETEEEKTQKQPTENVGKSGSHVSLTDELMTETRSESQEPAHIPPTEPVRADRNDDDVDEVTDASGRTKSNSLDAEADHKDVSPQAAAEVSSERDDNMINENISEETEVKVSQTLDLIRNTNENTKELEGENNPTSYVKNFQTQSESSLGSGHSLNEFNSNSMEQSENRGDKKDQTPCRIPGSDEEERAEITDTVLHLEKSSYTSEEITARDEEDLFDEDTDLSQKDIFTTQTEESSSQISDAEESNEQGQLLSSLEERNEHLPHESFTPPTAETSDSNLNTPSITGDNVETEIHHGELGLEEKTQPGEGRSQEESSHSGGKITESRGTILPNKTIRNINHTSGFSQSLSDADKLKETVNDQNEEAEKETLVYKEEVLSVSNSKLHLGPETQNEKSGDGRNEETTEIKERDKEKKKWEVKDEVKTEEEQRELKDLDKKEKKKVDRTLKEEEEEEKVDDSEEESKGGRVGEEGVESKQERQREVGELKKKEKQVPELPEKEKQVRVEGFKKSEEVNEKEETEEEKQVQEKPLENIQSDTAESGSHKKDTSDVKNLVSLVTDVVTESESQKMEEEERDQTESKESEKVEDVTVEGILEKQPKKHEEDDRLMTSNQILSQEAAELKGAGGNSEDGRRSTAAATAWTGEQDDNKMKETQVKDSAEEKASNKQTVRGSEGSEEQTRRTDDTGDQSESHHSEGVELSAQTHDPLESQAQASEQTLTEDPIESSGPPGATESENGGTFGLFKNAFGFFSQTPSTTSTGSTQTFNTNSAETSPPQAPSSPEQELEATTGFHTVPPTELLLPASTENIHPTASSIIETPPKTKILTKHYKNLLLYMSINEADVLLELFGQHTLQYLDYVLAGSETVAADDQSILSDIERFLHHHVETLVAPSVRLTDAPQEDKEKTRSLIALQKLEMLLKTVKDTLSTGISDVSKHQDEHSCPTCSTQDEEKKPISQDALVAEDKHVHRDEWMTVEKDQMDVKEKKHVDWERRHKGSEKDGASQEGLEKQMLDFINGMNKDSNRGVLTWQVVSSLPDDMRPGPDLYGVPWEPVIITGLVGLVTFLLFTCRCYSSIKSRMYRSKEHWMSEQIVQLLDEKCKVLETLSQCQQEYDDLENPLRDSGVLAQAQTAEHLEAQVRQLQDTEKELERDLDHLKDQLDQQRENRKEQGRRIAVLEESLKTFEEETKDLQSQEEQAQTTLKIYDMNSDRLQRNLETEREENTVLQESNTQLRQQVEGWAERVSELEAEMQRCEVTHNAMLQDVGNKDKRIMSLTDRLLRMKGWDSELEGEDGEKEATNGTPGKEDLTDTHLQKVQKLIYAAKLNADLKSVDEDKDRVFAKLNDEIKAKEDLQVSIQELEHEKLSLHSDSKHYSEEVERLQQKLHIMTEMYQENELKLHRMLTVEEKERLQKEEKLNKADKNIAMALEELNNYRKRAEEMEDELEKTKQSYQTQISSHEKKAHNNWLAARAAERELGDIRRENALLRQKLTDTQFKLDSLDKDPYALHSLARPLPFRAERSPYGPSPLGRPSSETRAFLSPPTLMDGPPTRLSPRVPCGPVEPPGGQGDMERSGGPHSDSSSNSPTWERDRRGPPPGLQGGMFPEPGGPLYRRPPPAALGLLPPPGSLPPNLLPPRGLPPVPPHPSDIADGSFRENRLGPGDQEIRLSGPGDQRTPPESDPRMGGPLPPMIPVDGPFPRRAPYGPPPPPDFYPPRGPGVPPLMPRWPPPHQRMMLPPHLHPPGGPPLPPLSHPHMPPYGAPMGPPPPDGFPHSSMGPPLSVPPHQSLPSPPHSQSSQENVPSPEDAI